MNGRLRGDSNTAEWRWVVAINASDYGDPEPLAELFRGGEVPPLELRGIVADIMAGARKPRGKAAAKIKIPARERLAVGCAVDLFQDLLDTFQRHQIVSNDSDLRGAAAAVALDERFMHLEAAEYVAMVGAERKRVQRLISEGAGVSVDTLLALAREYRRVVRDYPNI